VELLTPRLPDLSPELADQLAEALGDLPVALEQAVGLLRDTLPCWLPRLLASCSGRLITGLVALLVQLLVEILLIDLEVGDIQCCSEGEVAVLACLLRWCAKSFHANSPRSARCRVHQFASAAFAAFSTSGELLRSQFCSLSLLKLNQSSPETLVPARYANKSVIHCALSPRLSPEPVS
jgi:hypothetical protein